MLVIGMLTVLSGSVQLDALSTQTNQFVGHSSEGTVQTDTSLDMESLESNSNLFSHPPSSPDIKREKFNTYWIEPIEDLPAKCTAFYAIDPEINSYWIEPNNTNIQNTVNEIESYCDSDICKINEAMYYVYKGQFEYEKMIIPHSIDWAYENKKADCTERTYIFVSLMKSMGFDSWGVYQVTEDDQLWSHLFPIVKYNGEWYAVDDHWDNYESIFNDENVFRCPRRYY